MIWSLRGMLLLVVAFGFLATATPTPAQPVFALYDNFSKFDPAKWRGTEFQPGNNQETSRMIVNGQLQLFMISWGSEADNTGSSGFGNVAVQHPNPNAVTAIQSLVTVVQGTAQGCPDNDANAGGATVRAEIRGAFFNDGTSTGANDMRGDIYARFEKRLNDFGRRQIRLQVLRCTDAACNNMAQLTGSPITFTTSWEFGQAHLMRLVWDQANHQFVATVLPAKGKTPPPEIQTLTYGLSDTNAPVGPTKALRIQAGNSNCTDGATISAIQALFDNVSVNKP